MPIDGDKDPQTLCELYHKGVYFCLPLCIQTKKKDSLNACEVSDPKCF